MCDDYNKPLAGTANSIFSVCEHLSTLGMSGSKRANSDSGERSPPNDNSHVEDNKRARFSGVCPEPTSSGSLVDPDSLNFLGNPLGLLAELGSREIGISSQNVNAGKGNPINSNTGNLFGCNTRKVTGLSNPEFIGLQLIVLTTWVFQMLLI